MHQLAVIVCFASCRVPLEKIALDEAAVEVKTEHVPHELSLVLRRESMNEPCIGEASRWATIGGTPMVARPIEPDKPNPNETLPAYQRIDPCGRGGGWAVTLPSDFDTLAEELEVLIAEARDQTPLVRIEVPHPFGPYAATWGSPTDGRARVSERVWLSYTPKEASATLVRLRLQGMSTQIEAMDGKFHNGFVAFNVPEGLPAGTGELLVLLERHRETTPCSGAPRCTFTAPPIEVPIPFEVLP
ncbi:MAG: hypothetical protein IT381_08305 [Deltaproteobacteria bacterium]|nr:hypothetical protein [Deltaproteobacteria bacterium]